MIPHHPGPPPQSPIVPPRSPVPLNAIRRPAHRRSPAAALLLGVTCALASTAALVPPPAGAALRSWSAVVDPVLSEDGYPPTRVVADGRMWSLELSDTAPALLQSRSLRTGRMLSSVRVAIPVLPGTAGLGGEEDYDNVPGPSLVVAGGHAAAVGTWCASFNEGERGGGDGCQGPRGFFAAFSTRTGRILRGGLTDEPRRLVAGDRPAEVVERPGAPTVLRDIVTRRTLMTVPRRARSVLGAGRYVAWDTYDGPGRSTRTHVRRRGATRDRYVLPHARLERAIGGRDEPIVQEASVTADGSVDLVVVVGSERAHAVAVDRRGRVRRLPVSLSLTSGFETRQRGDRLLVSLASIDGRCRRSSSWITDLRGRTGNALTRVPAKPGRRLADTPQFLPGGALVWEEETRRDVVASDRIRVLPDVHDLPLTRAGRPGC